MSAAIALVGFPRLQEQITTRLLAEHDLTAERVAITEASSKVDGFALTMFYWPDSGNYNEHLQKFRAGENGTPREILFVTTAAGKQSLQRIVDSENDILVTPLLSQDLRGQLTQRLKIAPKQDPNAVDVEYLNPFVEGTVITLKQMADMECERIGLRLSKDTKTSGEISGTIGLSGETEGFVSVVLTHSLANKIVAKMLMMDENEPVSDEDLQDGIGEFMNVVGGYAKAQLANTEHSFLLSIPSVIYGGPHHLGRPRGLPVFILDFKAQDEVFHVLVCLVPGKNRK
jgi:chemotaxis protein CheX